MLLSPPRALLEQRLQRRAAEGGHFTPGTALLDSQLAALEYHESELLLRVLGWMKSGHPGRFGQLGFPEPHEIVDAVMRQLRGLAVPSWATYGTKLVP